MKAVTRSFPLHHGSLALCFIGTVRDRGSEPFERIDSPDALSDWLAQTELLERQPALTVRARSRALELREALARSISAVLDRRQPAAADVAVINAAAKTNARVELDPQTLERIETVRDPFAAALGRIARDGIDVISTAETRARLRTCGLDSCGSIFLTPAGRRERRWCSMERCGNRSKASAFRQRQTANAD